MAVVVDLWYEHTRVHCCPCRTRRGETGAPPVPWPVPQDRSQPPLLGALASRRRLRPGRTDPNALELRWLWPDASRPAVLPDTGSGGPAGCPGSSAGTAACCHSRRHCRSLSLPPALPHAVTPVALPHAVTPGAAVTRSAEVKPRGLCFSAIGVCTWLTWPIFLLGLLVFSLFPVLEEFFIHSGF